jgi:hypothetical protein
VRARTFDNEDLLIFRPESFDFFGSEVASGDFNGDGVDDLATGIPNDDGIAGSGCTDCGGVVVRYGISGRGLDTALAVTLPELVEPGHLTLSDALAATIEIRVRDRGTGKGQRGEVAIAFASLDELDGLLGKLGHERS